MGLACVSLFQGNPAAYAAGLLILRATVETVGDAVLLLLAIDFDTDGPPAGLTDAMIATLEAGMVPGDLPLLRLQVAILRKTAAKGWGDQIKTGMDSLAAFLFRPRACEA